MKSKLNIKSILIFAIIGIISLVCFNPSFAANTAKITVETANIRKTPDVKATILEQASKGEKVEVLEKSGDWYKVKYKGISGYLRKDLLDVADAEKTETNTNAVLNNTTVNNTSAENTQAATNTQETNTTPAEATQTPEKTQEANNTQVEPVATETPAQPVATENVNVEISSVYRCTENVKLRIIPLIMGNEIKEINKDTEVNVLEIKNKWALVESGTNRGWVLVSKLQKATIATTETVAQPVEEKKEETAKTENTEQKQETTSTNEVKQENTETKQEAETKKEETVKETTKYVNSDVVNLRQGEGTSSKSIAKLSKGTQVTVVSENNGWSKVKANGKEGYILSSLLSTSKPKVTSRAAEEPRQDIAEQTTTENKEVKAQENTSKAEETKKETPVATSNKGTEVCNYAKQYLGCKYVYGGTSPSGFDCSGFTQYVYKHFGVTLNRTAEAQASNGTAVSKSNLKAGDLVIFTSHVGIYLGNGSFIHAANPKKGVIITSLSDSYYVKHYITARRIFN